MSQEAHFVFVDTSLLNNRHRYSLSVISKFFNNLYKLSVTTDVHVYMYPIVLRLNLSFRVHAEYFYVHQNAQNM